MGSGDRKKDAPTPDVAGVVAIANILESALGPWGLEEMLADGEKLEMQDQLPSATFRGHNGSRR